MLTWLRKHTKTIMVVVAVLFAVSMFYGLGYRGLKNIGREKTGFIQVNGKEISPRLYANIYQKIRESAPGKLKPSESIALQAQALQQTIDFAVMLDDAQKNVGVSGGELNQAIDEIAKQQKYNSVDEFKAALERTGYDWNDFKRMLKDDMTVQKMVRKIRDEVSVSPNDLREIKVRHILIRVVPGKEDEAKKLADSLMDRIRKGEDFAALAKKYSEDPGSKNSGGLIDFFSTGAMVKPFEDLAFSLKVGEVGGPVKTEYGYHIIKLEDARLRKIKGAADPEKAILQQKQQQAYMEWIYKIKQNAKVEILDPSIKALDLRFRGRIGDAVTEYQKAIAQHPENAYLHLALGQLYEDAQKTDLAIYEYKQAILREAGDPTLYITLGDAYRKNKQSDLAIEQYKKASMIAGDDRKTHEELNQIFKQIGQPALALQEVKELARIDRKEAFEKSLREKAKVKTE
ncbi:MAG TPA: peptidylprolyl isomerase [Candidatus Omnitrophota bacterium]|nr:peptidylprolyl isomerase [Candidatus Omnitrophota bacterium]